MRDGLRIGKNGERLGVRKAVVGLVLGALLFSLTDLSTAQAISDYTGRILVPGIQELDLVYIHGVGANSEKMKLLEQKVDQLLTQYAYSRWNPGYLLKVKSIRLDIQPSNAAGDWWRLKIAEGVHQHFPRSKGIVLIGFSTGGKAALEAVARQQDYHLWEIVASVITLNAPIDALSQYAASPNLWWSKCTIANGQSYCNYVGYESSVSDANLVAARKPVLTLRSYLNCDNILGYTVPHDGRVPYPAQTVEQAYAVDYGYCHGDIEDREEAAQAAAEKIVRFIFMWLSRGEYGGFINLDVFGYPQWTLGGDCKYGQYDGYSLKWWPQSEYVSLQEVRYESGCRIFVKFKVTTPLRLMVDWRIFSASPVKTLARTIPSYDDQDYGITDFDGDGIADIAWWNSWSGALQWQIWLGRRSSPYFIYGGALGSPQDPYADGDKNLIIWADFNGDRKTDFMAWNKAAGMWDLRLSRFDGNSLSFRSVPVLQGFAGGDKTRMIWADFDGDGKTDIMGWNGCIDQSCTRKGWDLRLARVDGSGNVYFVPAANNGIVLEEYKNGFVPLTPGDGGDKTVMFVADFNGDNKADILRLMVYRTCNNCTLLSVWRLWLSKGDSFETYRDAIPGKYSLIRRSIVADFNGDAKSDLLTVSNEDRGGDNPIGKNWTLFISTGTGFSQINPNLGDFAEGNPNNMLWGDFNGDGVTDVMGWNEQLRGWDLRLGSHTGVFRPGGVLGGQQDAYAGGDKRIVITGDFNGDGLTDIIAWNSGLNKWDLRVAKLNGDKVAFDGAGFVLDGVAGGDKIIMIYPGTRALPRSCSRACTTS